MRKQIERIALLKYARSILYLSRAFFLFIYNTTKTAVSSSPFSYYSPTTVSNKATTIHVIINKQKYIHLTFSFCRFCCFYILNTNRLVCAVIYRYRCCCLI